MGREREEAEETGEETGEMEEGEACEDGCWGGCSCGLGPLLIMSGQADNDDDAGLCFSCWYGFSSRAGPVCHARLMRVCLLGWLSPKG